MKNEKSFVSECLRNSQPKIKFFASIHSNHVFYVNSESQLLGAGDNECYELGLGHDKSTPEHVKIPFFNEKTIKNIKIGGEFTIFQTTKKTYVVGYNIFGQLCLGDTKTRQFPEEINFPDSITVINFDVGDSHVHFISEKFDVYSAGYNADGQLGLGDKRNRSVLTKVKFPLEERIFEVKCGMRHSIFFSNSRRMYCTGYNKYGQLGVGNYRNQYVPKEIIFFRGINFIKVRCGNDHTIVLNDKDEVYAFGRGDNHRLGTGTEENQPLPMKLTQICKDFSCGQTSTFLRQNGKIMKFNKSQPTEIFSETFIDFIGSSFGCFFIQENRIVSTDKTLGIIKEKVMKCEEIQD